VKVEFPTSFVVARRDPFLPRFYPWVYLEVEGLPRPGVGGPRAGPPRSGPPQPVAERAGTRGTARRGVNRR